MAANTSAPREIVELVEAFDRNIAVYRSANYKETPCRQEYINPFFESLGWDVSNKAKYAEAYKDVVAEESVEDEGTVRAPDYTFRIGGTRKFFVEAKKPMVNIKESAVAAYQLRRYAWSAKLPLSVLNSFRELAVYDCRVKPKVTDKASAARILYLTYDEYSSRWSEVASIFSREAVLQGSFDRFAETAKGKRGTAEVDKEFLREIESWRDVIARNMALRNPDLTSYELNYAVQQTIDRIIFLRICEDRGIEPYGRVGGVLKNPNIYTELFKLFESADQRYNSGLFHFREEPGRPESPDTLTPRLSVGDRPLKEMIGNLYYPESPYEFSVLPAEILGQVYEQFLGKVIRLTPGHRAVVEDKPEVKKAGGVFYTPSYIVDYIVRRTLGPLLEGRTPEEAAKVKLVDPACGSGSFLIAAYQHLLDWHLQFYTTNGTRKHKAKLYQGKGDVWHLTIDERRRILMNSIHGVDIDPQAVEVTKLSLLLKVLEGETQEDLQNQLRLFYERALPDLGSNIKCGNTLIGPEFYSSRQVTLWEDDERRRINAFDWKAEFPAVFSSSDPGFDAVIGNPPYIRIQVMKEWAPVEVEYYKQKYETAKVGNYDIYVAFVERGLSLLRSSGLLGFILPHKFFNARYGKPLREILSTGRHIAEIVNFRDQQVFAGASTYTCLLILSKRSTDRFRYAEFKSLSSPPAQLRLFSQQDTLKNDEQEAGWLDTFPSDGEPWTFSLDKQVTSLVNRLKAKWPRLDDRRITKKIFRGGQTSKDEVFILTLLGEEGEIYRVHSEQTNRDYLLERDLLKPLVKGGQMKRYYLAPHERLLLFPYKIQDDVATILKETELRSRYPRCWAYLEENREVLRKRKGIKEWYSYGFPKNLTLFQKPKILTPDFSPSVAFSYDPEGKYYFPGGAAGGYGIVPAEGVNPYFLLGILDSSLTNFLVTHRSTNFRGGWFSFELRFIEAVPIPLVNQADRDRVSLHDQLVSAVQQMVSLHHQRGSARAEHDRTLVERQVEVLDRQIDGLVYKLYALSDDEVATVESNRLQP